MPRIHDSMKDCVVYLYPTAQDAEDRERVGGTGFVIWVPLPSDATKGAIFFVTNGHVYRKAPVVSVNRHDGALVIVDLKPDNWIPHPAGDDLAIAPGYGIRQEAHKYRGVHISTFLTEEKIKEMDYGLGDDVFVIGRFINHEGQVQNVPTLRFGNIAQMVAPIHQSERNFDQESFLVEAKSISGYSGSPVFTHMMAMTARPSPEDLSKVTVVPIPGNGPWLLGVDWGHLHDESYLRDFDGHESKPLKYVWANSGMMGVVPAWKILEMLDLPEVKKVIEDTDMNMMKKRRNASESLDVATKRSADVGADDAQRDFEKTIRVMLSSPPAPHSPPAKSKRTRAKKR